MATKHEIQAEDGSTVRLVQAAASDKPDALAAALEITGVGAVVVLAGGADEADAVLRPRLVQLVGRGLVRAARDAGAVCIARAGATGLASLVGRAVADTEGAPPLLGVAPSTQVVVPGQPRDGDESRQPLAAGLTHLLLTAGGEWGSEQRIKIDLAQALAAGKPVLMVVIGGGASSAAEVLHAVRRRWPVLVVKRSGGAADELARQWEARKADGDDPVLAEIVADGNLACITLGDNVAAAVETMARQVLRQSGGESVLRQAWRRFGAIDAAAIQQQKDFLISQRWILVLGVVAVYLAIMHTLLTDYPVKDFPVAGRLRELLGLVLIGVPIGTSALIAATNRFKPGKRWVLLRSAAESIKREIYRYRLRAQGYDADDTREKKLATAVEDITRRLVRTEASTTALPAYTGPIPPHNSTSARDDGMGFLGADQYVRMRLEDQLAFYRRKTVAQELELRNMQRWVLLAGATGTFMAALGDPWVIWIALSTSLAGACMTYLSYRQVETTLVSHNQTATDLDNILSWWTSLEPEEQALRENVEALAKHTEEVLSNELAGWTQRMTDALEKLREAQAPKDGDGREAPRPVQPPPELAPEPAPPKGLPDARPDPAAPALPTAAPGPLIEANAPSALEPEPPKS